MANIKKISSALSVATTVLLGACSSESTDSGPTPVANITTPELVASWQTACIATALGTTTTTQASGGAGSSVSDGEAYRNSAIFSQSGRVEFFSEVYATSNCNANTLTKTSRYRAVYVIGDATVANDSSLAIEINYSDSKSTTYSIFQLVNNSELYLGDGATSTPENDGSSEALRLDGLGPRMLKQ